MLESIAKLTDDVNVTVNEKGIIKNFEYSPLLEKWKILKPQILQNNKGKKVESYLEGLEKRVKDEKLFLERLRDPRLFGLLFDGFQTLHEESDFRKRKISRFIYTFPLFFKEYVDSVEDRNELRYFSLTGKLESFSDEMKNRIKDYFSYFKIEPDIPTLSYYKKNAVIDLQNGFLKSNRLELEMTNSYGYMRKQLFELKQQ